MKILYTVKAASHMCTHTCTSATKERMCMVINLITMTIYWSDQSQFIILQLLKLSSPLPLDLRPVTASQSPTQCLKSGPAMAGMAGLVHSPTLVHFDV